VDAALCSCESGARMRECSTSICPKKRWGRGSLGSFQACLSSVLEIPVDEVPQHDDLHPAVAQWRIWLAGRGVGLVPVADAARFHWPGYWIAVVAATPQFTEQAAVLMFGTPAGVVLSPQSSVLLGRAAADLPVLDGYVVAPFDPAWPIHWQHLHNLVGSWR
jgi:hypothetical protein